MLSKKRLLAIVAQGDLFAKIEPLFQIAPLELHRASDGPTGLILCRNIPYELIISEFPVPGTDEDLLEVTRAPEAPCISAPVLLFGRSDALAYAARHSDFSTHVISPDASLAEVRQKISGLLGISLRVSSRLLVQIEVQVGGNKVLRACQTRDISINGMLLRTGQQLPLGSEVASTFYLPGDTKPLEAKIRVIRHTDPVQELPGMGVQFTWMSGEDQERLQEFLNESVIDAESKGGSFTGGPPSPDRFGRFASLSR